MASPKDDRLQIRVAPDRKRSLEEAAATTHQTVSAFVLQAAEMRADAILLDRQVVRLSPAAAQAFTTAMSEPAAVNDRLAEALGRPRKFSWID
jgi:uncharacterized protein (DUF1778 family)